MTGHTSEEVSVKYSLEDFHRNLFNKITYRAKSFIYSGYLLYYFFFTHFSFTLSVLLTLQETFSNVLL